MYCFRDTFFFSKINIFRVHPRSAISETANLDGQKMRYDLPSSREPSQIHKEQMKEEKIKWTDANQNIRLLRYDYPLAVGKRHIKNDVYDSTGVQEHLNYVTGNSSQSNGDISIASKARRQRNLRCSSNIFSAPEYPTSSKEIVRVFCVFSPNSYSKSPKLLFEITHFYFFLFSRPDSGKDYGCVTD